MSSSPSQAQLLFDRLAIFSGGFTLKPRRSSAPTNSSRARRLRFALVAGRPIACHGRLRTRQRAVSSARGHETIRIGEVGEAGRTADSVTSPRARASSGCPSDSIGIGTALPNVCGSAKPRPNSIISAPHSAGRLASAAICARAVFLPERLRGCGIRSLQ